MKRTFKYFLVTAAILSLGGSGSAQQVSATWPLTNPAVGGTGVTVQIQGQIQGEDESLAGTLLINQYTGPNNSQRIKLNLWPVNQLTQIDTVFIQYQVRPSPSYTLHIDSVALALGANSTQDMMANLYYSKDETFTAKTKVDYVTSVGPRVGKPAGVFLSNIVLDPISFAPDVDIAENERFYFRIYPWVDSSSSVSGKYVCPQNVVVYATAIPIPISAGAVWPLMTDEKPVVSGLIDGQDLSYGGGLYKYGFNANGDRWTINNGPSGSGSWPAESSPNFERYAQFALSPKIGGTFYPDSLKFTQIVEFTNNLRIAVYSSKSAAFDVKTFIADTAVLTSKINYAYAMHDTIASGETLYVRFYPYNVTGDPSWKLVDMSDVGISGVTTGLAILAPTVSTTKASYISTTFATSGGTVSADGGGEITARGICWNTAGDPAVTDGHTTDGTGIGKFVSTVTGLTPGTKYYLRAYATNVGGTAYGTLDSMTTLAAVVPPSLTTKAITSILVKTAVGGGTVDDWGGDTVEVRGICWNTEGSPTTADSKTIDGTDIGSFVSGMTGLTANTMYHVRAYAVNSAGTGYGNDITFTSQIPQPDTTVVVAKDGSGNYLTVQEAFRNVPANYTGKWTIFVRKGMYHEKDTLAAGKVNVILLGEERDSTVIWNDDYGDKYGSGNPGTSGTFTVTIDADDFIAKNITIQNTYAPQQGVSGTQAVALSANGDRQEYYNVALRGYQDTYYTRGSKATGRTYHKNCYIEGTVDFIFGRNIAVFDSCTIRELRNTGTLTAASTEATSQFGYVFRNCTIVADSLGYDGNVITSFHLGRPWQASPRTVYLNTNMPKSLNSAGWLAWNVTPGLYAEYHSMGEGASSANRVAWSSQLTNEEASAYSLANIFAKSSASSSLITYDWIPSDTMQADIITSAGNESGVEVPKEFFLSQNYPNPFNPSTTIEFTVALSGQISLKVFNVLGQEVAALRDGYAEAGVRNRVVFDAKSLASGMYFVRLQYGSHQQIRKMLLMK
jgi:pectinesterase